jgi:GDP-L-fucose synthase
MVILSGNANWKRCFQEWIFLSSKDGDLTDPKSTKEIFDKYKPTHVIHLAAMVRTIYKRNEIVLVSVKVTILQMSNFIQSHTF